MLFRLAPQTIWTGRVTSSSSYPTLCQHLAFSTPLQQHLSALTFTGVSDPIAIGGTDFLQDVHVALAAAAAAVGGGGGGGGNGSRYSTVGRKILIRLWQSRSERLAIGSRTGGKNSVPCLITNTNKRRVVHSQTATTTNK